MKKIIVLLFCSILLFSAAFSDVSARTTGESGGEGTEQSGNEKTGDENSKAIDKTNTTPITDKNNPIKDVYNEYLRQSQALQGIIDAQTNMEENITSKGLKVGDLPGPSWNLWSLRILIN